MTIAQVVLYSGAVTGVTAAVGAVWKYLIRPIYRFARKQDVSYNFAVDMATNHLPHIYHSQTQVAAGLQKIGRKLDVDVEFDLDNPPPIRFVSFEDNEDK